jgi:hypothetical protein
MNNTRNLTRRSFLSRSAWGLTLAAAATGLPAWFLKRPELLWAEELPTVEPTFLILSIATEGDPLNVNCPGAYVAGAQNNPITGQEYEGVLYDMAPKMVRFGAFRGMAAGPWSTLEASMLQNTCFLHHQCGTVAHTELHQLLSLHGRCKSAAGNGAELLPTALAELLGPRLGTLINQPLSLGQEAMTQGGKTLSTLPPVQLRELFLSQDSPLASLADLRRATLDSMYAQLKRSGTAAQRRFLDEHAISSAQAAALGAGLSTALEEIVPFDPEDRDKAVVQDPLNQITAAIALINLKVSPVITIHLPFGGDNHGDAGLLQEAVQTTSSISALNVLWQKMSASAPNQKITFASLNTFGRTMELGGTDGRSHNGAHHAMMLAGPHIKPGVVGGITQVAGRFEALGIDPLTGAAMAVQPTIAPDRTLDAAAATLGAAVGLTSQDLLARLPEGRPVLAALRTT